MRPQSELSTDQLALCLRAIGSVYPAPLPRPETEESPCGGHPIVTWSTPRAWVRAQTDGRRTVLMSRRAAEPAARCQLILGGTEVDLVDRLWGLFDWLCAVETEPRQGSLGFSLCDTTGSVEGGVV